MTIRAYDEIYVESAQNILGHAVDFAIMTLNVNPDSFGKALAVANSSKQFSKGNPKYVAGMTVCEFFRIVLTETHTSFEENEDVMYLDRSPEYWAGWALAYYQWYSNLSFTEIILSVSLSEILEMYPVYHEIDITNFVDKLDRKIYKHNLYTKLKEYREINEMSQSELSRDSNVPLRQIQLFEQQQRDINKTAAITLLRLSKALNCSMEDLLDYSYAKKQTRE